MGRNSKYDAIIIASLYFWPESAFRHSFFKGDAISHPLNPGATPWYFASMDETQHTSLKLEASEKKCPWETDGTTELFGSNGKFWYLI